MTFRPLQQRALVAASLVLAALGFAAPAQAIQFTSIAPGLNHTCAVKADHTAWCWGEGREGQVGVIGAVRPRTPIYVIGSYQTATISSGQGYWCGLLLDGTASCSGRAARGQIGNASTSPAQFPQEVSFAPDVPLEGITKVATGVRTTCALHNGGQVACWGDGERGQLGNGRLQEEPQTTPLAVTNLSGFVDIAVGDSSVCAVRRDGLVFCWGDTTDRQLGNANTAAIAIPSLPVDGITTAVAVAVGDRHACALKRDGTVTCWGNNTNGQLGIGSTGESRVPAGTSIAQLTGVTQIAASGLTTCAIKRNGTAVCWGDGTSGQIGNGARAVASSPQTVSGITDAMQIGVGSQHVCLVTKTLSPFCWGRNLSGQLGTGGPRSQVALTPQPVRDFVLGPVTFLTAEVTGVPAGSTAGGVVEFNQFRLARVRGSACPKLATLRLTARTREATQRIPVAKINGGCTVTGRYLLPRNTQDATRASYRLTGENLKPKSQALRPRSL